MVMLRIIIRKELLDNLLNLRFTALCAVAIVLLVTSIVVLTEQYRGEMNDYYTRVSTQDTFIDRYGHSNRIGWMSVVAREPSRYRPLVLGIDRDAAQENFVNNPVPALLSKLDFVAIVAIIMSLVAIILSHNAISGEREDGMLKLMLSTSISRSNIVLGKFIAGIITLSVPFTLGILLGIAYIALSVGFTCDGISIGVIGSLLFLSFLYMTAFYALGLLFSARSRTSNVAILKSLFAWVVLVLVLPNISPFLAAQIYTIPSRAKIERELTKIESDDRDQLVRERVRRLLQGEFSDLASVQSMTRADLQKNIESDASFRERFAGFRKAQDEVIRQVNIEQRKISKAIREDFGNRSQNQELLATTLASLSPLSNFVFAATDAADVGLESNAEWESQAGRYDRSLREYVERRYSEGKEKNPAFTPNDYLDLRGRPRFRFQPPPVSVRFSRILVPTAILAGFTLMFFAAAFVSFLRYDVR
jgi:ABC-type transport system involved in multi-copper enzyme maturation permease subunit